MPSNDFAPAIAEALQPFRRHRAGGGEDRSVLEAEVRRRLKPGEPLRLLLPAFPGKSANSEHVFGPNADAAEAVAVGELDAMTNSIASAYEGGVELVVLHDGAFYCGLPALREMDDMDAYVDQVHRMSTSPNITWLTVDDLFPAADRERAVDCFVSEYCVDPIALHDSLATDEDLHSRYRVFHSFLDHEIPMVEGQSWRARKRYMREATSFYMSRNLGVWKLIEERFHDHLLLSVHGHGVDVKKVGINLIRGGHTSGTPWFHCLLERSDGTREFVKRNVAVEHGFEMADGEHGYYLREANR